VHLQVETLEDQLLNLIGLDRAAMLKVSDLKAPMPGLVRQLLVQPGDEVTVGQGLLVLEAMKMENILKSPTAGSIAHIAVTEGQAVEKNALLIKFA
jgi:biotin carboxyl carrier protein